MAEISNVRLEIFETVSPAIARVSYRVKATRQDAPNEQAYREIVELIGVDEGPGEDGQNEVLLRISDSIVVFTTSQVSFQQIREEKVTGLLDEDPGPIIRRDELRARVSLIPLPPATVARESNLVTRGAPVNA